MAQAEPLTLSSKIAAGLNQFSAATTHTDAHDKFVFRHLFNECDRLQQIDVVAGSLYKAFLFSTIGDFSEVERWLTNAERNHGHDSARIERFTHLVNHGYATQALDLIEPAFAARMDNNLMDLALKAAAIGAFSKIVAAVEASQAKGEVLQMTNLYALSRKATEVTAMLGVTDNDMAAMLDVAGEFLRENRLLWQKGLPDITVLDSEHGGPALGIEYRIDVTPEQAASMSWRLTEALIERNLDRPSVFVDFLGTGLAAQLIA